MTTELDERTRTELEAAAFRQLVEHLRFRPWEKHIIQRLIAPHDQALERFPETESRALVFMALVISNLALIFVSRSGTASLASIYARQNAVFWIIIAVTLGALLAVVQVPAVADLFRFTSPPWTAAAAVAAAATGVVLLAGSVLQHQRLATH